MSTVSHNITHSEAHYIMEYITSNVLIFIQPFTSDTRGIPMAEFNCSWGFC